MSTGFVVLHVALAVVAFLVILNGYLRGAAKSMIDGVLSLAWIGIIALAWVLLGWRSALLALGLSFVYAGIANPLAKRLARRMLGFRTTLITDTEIDFSVEGLFQRAEEDSRRVAGIANKPTIAKVLAEYGLDAEDLQEQLGFLMSSGLGDLSWEVLSTPSDLRALLEMRADGRTPLEIAARLMQVG